MYNFKNNFSLSKKISIKLNLKIFKNLLKILPHIYLRNLGFTAIISIKKKYLLLYLKILKENSSFIFNYLSDISVMDFP